MTYVEMLDLRNVGFMIKVLASLSSIAKLLMTDIPCTRSCKSPVLAKACERLRVNFLKRPKKKYTVKI